MTAKKTFLLHFLNIIRLNFIQQKSAKCFHFTLSCRLTRAATTSPTTNSSRSQRVSHSSLAGWCKMISCCAFRKLAPNFVGAAKNILTVSQRIRFRLFRRLRLVSSRLVKNLKTLTMELLFNTLLESQDLKSERWQLIRLRENRCTR